MNCQLLLKCSSEHGSSSPPIRKLVKPAGRFCVDILRAQDDRVFCGYRGRGGLKVSNRWSNARFVGSSVLGGLEGVWGGGVAGRRKKWLRKVRFDDWIYAVCESQCCGALDQGARKPLQCLLWVARMSVSVGRVREDGCAVNGALSAIAQGDRSMSQDEEGNISDEVVEKFKLQASGFRLQVRGQDCLGVVNECCSREQSKSGVSPDTLGE